MDPDSLDFNENAKIKEAFLSHIDQEAQGFDQNKEEEKDIEAPPQMNDNFNSYLSVDNSSLISPRNRIIQREEAGQDFLLQTKEISYIAEVSQSEISRETINPLMEKLDDVFLRNEEMTRKMVDFFEILNRLKNQNEKYNENFTLVLDFRSNESKIRESLMRAKRLDHKENGKENDPQNDFATLFRDFEPLLFDLLKRREGFEDFTQTLRRLASKENLTSQNIIKKLEVKDILLLLIESCSQSSLPQLGLWISYQFYPLPLISLFGQKEYRLNLDCCLKYRFQVRKALITNIGTKSSIEFGKSSLLSFLFSTRNPAYFSTKNGFSHVGAVDLYVNLPSDQQNYMVADVQGFREDEEFMEMLSVVLSASQIVLVHITDKDILADGRINLDFKVNNKKSKVIYLWRDYYDDQSDLLIKAKKFIEKSENELAIIEIPSLAEQSFDVQSDKLKAMQRVFKEINILKLNNCTPIVDLFFKTFQLKEGLKKRVKGISDLTDFDKERENFEGLLSVESQKVPGKSFIESSFPCLLQDYRILEERKKKVKLLKQEMSEDQFHQQGEKYNEIQKRIQDCKRRKSEIQVYGLIQKVIKVISSNDLNQILPLSELINNWKVLRVEEVRNLDTQKDDSHLFEEQKKAIEMDYKDLSFSTSLDEVLSYYESNTNARDTSEYEKIKQYFSSCLMQGAPLNLVNGKTLKFGNDLFKEIFDQEIDDIKNIFVISIIGAQSSAKSTLLNELFGCGFCTSSGRCTEGIDISLLHHPSGFKIIVFDTEGLLSVVARDHKFDNMIMTMALSCSHVVIINNQGEIDSSFRDLLEIGVYAMKQFKLPTFKPKIILALRDIVKEDFPTRQEMFLAMKSNLEEAANELSINIDYIIDFSQQDVFLLPSAIYLVQEENKTIAQKNNNLFSLKILEMRQDIFQYLDSIKNYSIPNSRSFYIQTQRLWKNISKLGSDIMRAKNLLDIKLRDKAADKANKICQAKNDTILVNGQKLVDHHEERLKKNEFYSPAVFISSFERRIHQN